MPELPDVELYVDALRERLAGRAFERVRVASPFVLRTVDPPVSAVEGKRVLGVRRLGKRIVLDLEEDLHVAIHLMVAGRLHWKKPGTRPSGRSALAAFDLGDEGVLMLTEAATKHRAALHVLRGEDAVRALDAGGVEPLEASPERFREALTRENHTLKRALTDPRLFAGIGNAYSDEILHRARLSPMQLTRNLDDDEIARLHDATRAILLHFTRKLHEEAKGRFPEKVTAFRKDFAMHGKCGQPCPDCGTAVQRIVRGAGRASSASAPSRAQRHGGGENESNYCPRCQTGGKLLADRALSKLMHDDWPETIDEWEAKMGP